MLDRSRQKERKRLKREKKRHEIKRAQSVSPYHRIGRQGAVVECAVNSDWRERGQAVGFILRRGPDGKLGMATFLVDLWCAGLKDIWGRLDVMMDEFDTAVDGMNDRMDDTMEKCEASELNAIVAGGIRFANENGFRLPAHYQRWAAFFGDVSPANADLTHFGVGEGKLRWVAPMEDLCRRYIGGTVEDFLARKDVEFIIEDESEWEGDDEDEYDEEDSDEDDVSSEEMDNSVARLADMIIIWCRDRNIVPSPMLTSAIEIALTLNVMRIPEMDDEIRDKMNQGMEKAMQMLSPEETQELILADAQVRAFMSQFSSQEEASRAMDSAMKQVKSWTIENDGLPADATR